eukprot:gene20223-26253_t
MIQLNKVYSLVNLNRNLLTKSRNFTSITKVNSAVITEAIKQTKPLSNPKELLDKIDVFIFDCDGVIWKGDSLIEKVPKVLEKLRNQGKTIFFVTNNSTKSRKGYLKKFTSLGLEVKPEEIFSSSFAAAAYFEQNPLPEGKKVYIIGQEGIGEELDLIKVPHFGGPADAGKVIKLGPGVKVEHDHDVGAVVVDAVTHLTDEQEWAGNGSMVGAIKGCTGKEPIVVGKPSPLMIDYIVDKYKIEKSRICMVGDRLDTDVLFGLDNGIEAVLTLSGVTTKEKLLSKENLIQPTYYVNSIADFFPDI